ncbi:pepsin/retropepsin-like aspartic protease family protein [Neokomagataea anthophila]|uniref:Uncharacterized protein n=1 Tax=Neokomagataea anthophila TaxID=2826925 RepID=A0ABS5E799_9PROT|nr:hypothetical protein [Neokomagataea anthophila]MBR0559777.1 hypothetical protein [Neokomagataea anthophila]
MSFAIMSIFWGSVKKNPDGNKATWSPICVLLSIITLFATTPGHAAPSTSSCIEGATVVPLMGGDGDSPIIPVMVGTSLAAMFVSPALQHVFVRDTGAIWFPPGPTQQMRAQDGNITVTERTKIDNLQIGEVSLPEVPASLLDGDATHSAGGLPVVGLIGRDLLEHVEVLFDVPHKKLALFRWHSRNGCSETPASIFSGTVYEVPMDSDGGIPVVINGASERLQLDPDLKTSVLPRSAAYDAGVSDEMLAQDPRVTTQYEAITIGAKHQFKEINLGGDILRDFDFIVQNNIRGGALGENFFSGMVALLDFPHGRLIFQPTDLRNDAPILHLHFDESHQGFASVHESQGVIERK